MDKSKPNCGKPSNAEIVIKCVAKGYHECPFHVEIGEKFKAVKKIGDKGRALKVLDPERGQLGHLQREIVSIIWPVASNISW